MRSVSMMLGAVAAGDGVALAPQHSARLPHEGAVFVPLRPPVPFVELLAVSPRSGASPLVEAFCAQLRQRSDELTLR